VAELKQELSASTGSQPGFAPRTIPSETRAGVPWGAIIVIGLLLAGLFALLRRRQRAMTYPAPMKGPENWNAQGGYAGQAGPWSAPGSGGMGSGILGGLASGAAMGAGFAAGEAAIDHLFGSEHRQPFEGGRPQDGYEPDINQDMGGDDFGIAGDGSWDDGTSGGADGW
jgi:hypothetical protein